MRKLNSNFITKYISEAGSKQNNKNYFGFVEMDSFACWAVAESFDNDSDIISAQLVVDTVLDMFTRKPTLSKRKLKAYVKEAHNQLKQQSSKFQLKSSILIVASDYKKMRYALCGNSRLHIFRGNSIFLKSQDQSLYQEMINEGEIPDDGERGMEESRNLFDYLGKQGRLKISVSKKIEMQDGDIMLLTTWGFWEKISTVEMLDALEDAIEAYQYLDELQDLYLSKQDKTVNNYTLAAIFSYKTFQEKSNKKKIITIVLLITIPLLIICIVLLIYLYISNTRRIERIASVTAFEQQGDVYITDENYDRALIEYDNGLQVSRELKETKGKNGQENKEIKDRLTTKQRISQLIIDGDSLFKDKNYKGAISNYEKALKEAKYNMDFYDLLDIEDIENKIVLCDDYEYTLDLIALADGQADLEQYDEALKNYDSAKKIAVKNKNFDAEKDIKLKTESIKSKLKSARDSQIAEQKEQDQKQIDDKIKTASTIELDGDKAVTAGKYSLATGYYNQAIGIYKENGALDKASSTEKKITDVNEKIKKQQDELQISVAEGYIQTGDYYMLEGNYSESLQNYKLARNVYIELKMADEIAKTNEKISIANISIKEAEVAAKILEYGLIESDGDVLLKAGDYTGAKEKYRQAQTLYQGINQMDKVLSVATKIKDIETIQDEKSSNDGKSNIDRTQ